jgi:polyphenol oxidase
VIRWEAPGPYRVAFTSREGGVSTGAFSSLNLGARADDAGAIAENRRIACAELGLDAELLAVNRQQHTTVVNRARARARTDVGDGLWSDEPGLPLLALGADCVPIAIVTTSGPPRLAVVHAGWRGLADGVIGAGVAALGDAPTAAAVGPAIGPCCYKVGPEVSARFDPDLTSDGVLDLWEASARRLRDAGVGSVERLDLCTRCNPDRFFSYRRTGAPPRNSGGDRCCRRLRRVSATSACKRRWARP